MFIVANHRDFYVPEPGEKRITDNAETLIEQYKQTHWIFPLEAHIHSGVRLALSNEGNFPDRQWDVSQLGFVFAAKSEWRLRKSARKAALCLVNTWNEYLSGDVWGYIVGDDSCWGFYGFDNCLQEGQIYSLIIRLNPSAKRNYKLLKRLSLIGCHCNIRQLKLATK